MPGTTIVKCSCKHDFQDEKYGKGNRVANLSKDDKTCTCTVCSTKHNVK